MKHLLLTTIAAVVLVECGPSVDIWEAAMEGNIEVVKQHLAAGTDVDERGGIANTTPLLEAARGGGHKEIVELLIANGADVNVRGFLGMTPLNMADDEGEKEIADLLRKHGGKTGKELKTEGK